MDLVIGLANLTMLRDMVIGLVMDLVFGLRTASLKTAMMKTGATLNLRIQLLRLRLSQFHLANVDARIASSQRLKNTLNLNLNLKRMNRPYLRTSRKSGNMAKLLHSKNNIMLVTTIHVHDTSQTVLRLRCRRNRRRERLRNDGISMITRILALFTNKTSTKNLRNNKYQHRPTSNNCVDGIHYQLFYQNQGPRLSIIS